MKARAAKLCSASRQRLIWLPCLIWAAGCGAASVAAPPGAPPGAGGEPPPRAAEPEPTQDAERLDDTEHQQRRLDGPSSTRPARGASLPITGATPDASLSWQTPGEDATLEQWEAWLNSHSEALAASADCASACRALGSLARAQAKVCELVGSADPAARCKRAEQRVAAARVRVETQCKCPAPAR